MIIRKKALNQSHLYIDSIQVGEFALKEVDVEKYWEYKLKYITSLKYESGCSRDIF